MKILPSHKISGQLLDVILEAQKELVLVSPYVDLSYSKQVSSALVAARNRGVNIAFYIRHESSNLKSKEQVESIGITPRLIPNLHAKLYFNETTGIIASLNLLSSSIGNSIEIGGQLETPEELAQLRQFVAQFITPHEVDAPIPLNKAKSIESPVAPSALSWEEKKFQEKEFGAILADYLRANIDRNSYVEGNDVGMTIRAVGNTFSIEIESMFTSIQLAIQGIVSSSEADRFAAKSSKHYKLKDYSYLIQRGGRGVYDQVRAVRKVKLSAKVFNKLTFAEKKQMLTEISDFLLATQAFKADYRN
ncbi:phospholipase D-like domain-containing protein [Hymenobacter psychrotolerans]|uniref:PLD-like domain-containing protein n=1 Tax=Hymenobacter psychrotolerans DSM 18569 TaxID=1121959 RepID=A0A1M6UQE0_9BACT|nr:hypothetical protein [Hymenobacter psychrotolerans]SHK71380.1 hypothetical protein SAMN02746009_01442 [Hymenobacter psychrotolerans DSM 18569]